MKLNNKGWGYRDMIIYSSIIIIALVIVAISISSFYDSMDIPYNPTAIPDVDVNDNSANNSVPSDYSNSKDYYMDKELELKDATLNYLNRYSYDMKDEILTVSLETLVSFDFIEPLYDYSGLTTCSGYSNVFVTSQDTYEIKPFISCSDYVTNGY